jgi:hypothetical protein
MVGRECAVDESGGGAFATKKGSALEFDVGGFHLQISGQ